MTVLKSKDVRLGLVGFSACGKDSVANYLVSKYGFKHVSSGDLVRAYIKANNLGEPTRELVKRFARELRDQHGGDYLVNLALGEATSRLVLTGLRVIPEIESFKKAGGVIVAVTSPQAVRYQWLKKRGDIDSTMTLEQFKDFEHREAVNADPNAQNVQAVVDRADYIIDNSNTLDDLYKKVDDLLQDTILK